MSNPGAASTQTTTFVGGGSPVYVGTASTSYVTFYGGTPVQRQATITTVTTTGASSSTPFGYTTSTQADAIVTAVNAILARLTSYNLIA